MRPDADCDAPTRALRRLAPSGAVVVSRAELPPALPPLRAEEAAAVARAVAVRQLDFAAGRACARAALERLGWPAGAIPVGPAREPVWPAGVVGSITHCPGFAAAVVGPAPPFDGLGLDVERDDPLTGALVRAVTTPAERRWLAAGPQPGLWAKVLFSAKESVYKAIHPTVRRMVDFLEVDLDLSRETGEFTVARGPVSAAGRFALCPPFVLTVAARPLVE